MDSNSLPHYFIGIPVPEKLKDRFAAWQQQLTEIFPFKQWTFKDDFHITLRFLGPVSENTLSTLNEMVKSIESREVFSLNIDRLDTFGNRQRPRVLFANVENTPPLMDLYECLEAKLEKAGFTRETRPYRPHITLAKKWNNQKRGSPDSDKWKGYNGTSFKVDSVVLFQVFPKQKPRYKPIYRYTLRGEINGTID